MFKPKKRKKEKEKNKKLTMDSAKINTLRVITDSTIKGPTQIEKKMSSWQKNCTRHVQYVQKTNILVQIKI